MMSRTGAKQRLAPSLTDKTLQHRSRLPQIVQKFGTFAI